MVAAPLLDEHDHGHATGPAGPGSGGWHHGNDPIVVGEGIVKRYGSTTALSDASFTIGHGVTGLLGSNGAGKTTLFGLLLGLHYPDEGRLSVMGLDPRARGAEVRALVGYSPEHHNLPPDIRAHELVRHLAQIHGLPAREATARASDALWQVGLGEERARPFGTMSTGQKQRVKLAQAIAHDPKLVLLDEPTDGLDPVQRDDMLALIRRISSEFGLDVVLSSHLLEEVERICDSAIIIAGGRVARSGRLADLVGRDGGVEIVIDAEPDTLADWLRRAGVSVTVDRRTLLVDPPTAGADERGPRPIDLHDLVRDGAVACGVGIRRMVDSTVRLEDVYLEASELPPASHHDGGVPA